MRFRLPVAVLALFGAAYAQTPPPHPAWLQDQVHEIRLTFANADWYEVLTKNYSGTEADNPYFPATLEWGPYKYESVGVRFKGNSSYSSANTKKKPFRIKTNEFVKGQKVEGIASFNLSNAWGDPSFVRENAYYEMATALGLKAPRSNFAALYINNQYWGLYVLGEVVNSDFLKNYFGKNEDTGNMYKGNIGASFAYLGTDKTRYKEVWEKQTNEEADDWADLIALCKLINDTPASGLRAALEPIMDVDSVLAALALDNATANLDSYVGMGQNFNIYKRPSDGRWVWIVWDPSLAFGAHSQGLSIDAMKTLAIEWVNATGAGGGGLGGRPLATKLWAVPEYKERYRQMYKRLMETVFLQDKVVGRMNTLRTMIWPYVTADTQKLTTQTAFESAMTTDGASTQPAPGGGGGRAGAPGLQPFITARLASINSQLTGTTGTTVTMTPSLGSLSFVQDVTGAAPASQTVNVSVASAAIPASYGVIATADGGNWLTITPATAVLPASFKASVSASGMGPGRYEGSLTLRAPSATTDIKVPMVFTVTAASAPTISAVVNAASYDGSAVAPGEIVTIFGSAMGPSSLTQSTPLATGWPAALSGVKVTFDGVAAPLLYVKNNQIGVVAPFELAGKANTQVQVSFGSGASANAQSSVVSANPGIFTMNASGTGAGAIVNQDGAVNSTTAAAARGSVVSIYLTGAGVTTPSARTGAANAAGQLLSNVSVTIGGAPAEVKYAGVAPGAISGLYQVNAAVPSSLAAGNAEVRVSVGGVASQAGVTMVVR